mmetsp:Transcript_9321/g.25295  ORF Transcript_9321/g.25295 Transcript_9321/m.25295 type:complete len:271 (-) Transcript_9321:1786-2598(-)
MRPLHRRVPIKGRGYSLMYQAFGPLMCNTYALMCDITKQTAIVDPSCQSPDEFEVLLESLEDAASIHHHGSDGNSYTVSHILLTHGHCDHVIGVKECLREWPRASLHLHGLEQENYDQAAEVGRQFGVHFTEPAHLPLPQPTDEIVDGQRIAIGDSIRLQAVHTPGHAPGHVAFCDDRPSDDTDGSVILSGDLLFRGSVGRTDFPNASIDDLYASLYRVYDKFHDDSIVLSGHTTATFLRKEKESNPFVAAAIQRPQDWWEEAKLRNGWQ